MFSLEESKMDRIIRTDGFDKEVEKKIKDKTVLGKINETHIVKSVMESAVTKFYK